ncbi:MAG TPA: nucleoside hydrolase [Chloroflexota bacterium]|nr:nucleoside hydrolase [Chloroflexota bacterium]
MRVILDVDTGVDDALALALAVRHPQIQLEAVTTVAGNVGLELTTQNTLTVLDWLGASDVPVVAGADGPLSGPAREASHWHGPDGLGGAQLPASGRRAMDKAADYLVERIMAAPGEISLVCTAPLTNLAHAIQRNPNVVQAVQQVVLMGGVARPPGNVTPTAEFNVYADPHAAALVFEQDWPLSMVGLDVTNQVVLTRAERDALAERTTPEAVLVREVTRHLFDVRGVEAMALHDPLAVGVAVQPDLVTRIERDVAVETRGELTLGQTVVDLRSSAPPPRRRTRVCEQVDAPRFKALFYETLGL